MNKATAANLTTVQILESMTLGDTPLTGNGFVQACRVVLGARGHGSFIPCSLNELYDAEQRIAAVINARGLSLHVAHDRRDPVEDVFVVYKERNDDEPFKSTS